MSSCRCGTRLAVAGHGRIPSFCSTRCRVAAHRARHAEVIPAALRELPHWTRRAGKRPVTVEGKPASSTNAETWTTYAEAKASTAGNGFGVMLGSGLACWDLDHCIEGDVLAPWAAEVLASIDSPIWVERSMSMTGLHIFVSAPEGPGRRRDGVEFYSRARFIAVTGDCFNY